MNWHWLAVYFIAGLASLANTCRFMCWHCLCLADGQTNSSKGVRVKDVAGSDHVASPVWSPGRHVTSRCEASSVVVGRFIDRAAQSIMVFIC